MKQSAPVVWTLLVVLTVGLLLLLDPFAWFEAAGSAAPVTPPAAGSTDTADDSGSAPQRAGEVDTDARAPDETAAREVVDPLAEVGLASFRVVLPPDRPVAGAQVLVARDDRLLCDERTDHDGEVVLTADGRPAVLFVAVERRPLEQRDVVLDVGRQEIRLADGGCVAGRFVSVDGNGLGELTVDVRSDPPMPSVESAPSAVENALAVRVLRGTYAAARTDAEGYLELTGLPATWSGRLFPRGRWRITATTHGDPVPYPRGIRLAEPTVGFVVTLAPRLALLHGRLVLRDDGSPLADARVSSMVRSPDQSTPEFSVATTDPDGKFEIDVRGESIDRVELHLGSRFHDGPPILVLDAAEVPGDGELGDVVVDGVRHVPFRLQDTRGKGIVDGVASAAGTRSASTGRDGLGELRWLPRTAVRMAVEAPGFVPTEAEIPPVVVSPLVVTMERASELAVRLELPDGAEPGQFRIMLTGTERITAVPVTDRNEQRRHVSDWAFPLGELFGKAPDTYLCARPDARGSATFRALRSGVELGLRVCGMTGDMVYDSRTVAPLAPAEHREVVVPLVEGLIVFHGRVLAADGAPLAGVTVQLGNQILAFTDGAGTFHSFLSTPETATLILQHQACATRYVPGYQVPTDGRPVEFRLSPARQVSIEVVDTNGEPVPQAEVWTRYAGFTTNTHRVGGNRHVAMSVPEAPFEIVVKLAGREYRVEHDPALREARVVVPVQGRLVAQIADESTAGRTGRFVVVLQPTSGEPASVVTASERSTSGLRIEIPAVHPGTYDASLRYEPSDAERETGREGAASKPVPVVIEPGNTTEIRLVLPADGG